MRRPAHMYAPIGLLALLTLGACSVPPQSAGTTNTSSPSSPVPIGAVIDDTPSATVPALAAASPQGSSGNPYPFGLYPAPGGPMPTPIPPPTSTPDLQAPLVTDLGNRQEAESVAVTVLSMERMPIAQPAAPYPGPAGQPHDQITLELLVENVGRDTLLFYAGEAPPAGVSSVRLLDTSGQTYQPAPFTPHRRYQGQRSVLLRGDRLRHTLVYAVPPDTNDLRLRFDPRAHNPGTYPIEVNLERAAANVPPLPAAASFPLDSPLIGEPQQIGVFAVTVLNVERRAHEPEPVPSPATPATPAYTDDVLVDVLFENTSMEEQDYSLLGGYLKDQDGYEYVEPLNGFGRLSSGERARVTFVFTVHQQADGFRLGMLTPAFGQMMGDSLS